VRSGAIQWQAESEHSMLNTSVTHITELQTAVRDAVHVLSILGPDTFDDWPLDYKKYGERLKDAAESFGLDLSDNDPFGTGDLV